MIPRCQMKIIHSAVDNDIFKKIFDDEKLNYPVFICKTYCWGGLNNNEIPKFSKLNNMFLNQSNKGKTPKPRRYWNICLILNTRNWT